MTTRGHQTPTNPVQVPAISGVVLGPFQTNCYVVRFPERPECWIVDAGYEPGELIDVVNQGGLKPAALILTHAHCDHIAGAFEVAAAFPGLPVWIHEAEREWLTNPILNLSAMAGVPATGPEPSRLLRNGDELTLSGETWRVLHTPGHSPGGITLWHEPSATALVGDTLFAGSVGRSDFPGSDPRTLERSIRDKLYALPNQTRIYPGHGPSSTIGRERATNPFVKG